ncbi:MAG TPA: SRPBCC family protein [Promineifilum sp.]|nr:SRPBCC family protein [Promineifilum sp.]HRO92130.1 SRPBCC family protein [Promineifilum sp.]HRQ13306.1 SRPBCC family protein [Promineifilum sp.]
MSKPEIIVEPGSQEIVTKMTFNAPRALIFKAYTDPDLIPQWYGPRYLTTVVDVLDARAGGSWRFLNYDPEGNVYAFHGVYHDVVAPERIVQTFEYEGMPGHVVMETAVFEDLGDGKTRVVTQSVFQSVEDRDGMAASGMEVGVNEGYERMNELMATLQ